MIGACSPRCFAEESQLRRGSASEILGESWQFRQIWLESHARPPAAQPQVARFSDLFQVLGKSLPKT
jgi:hypothetical protein